MCKNELLRISMKINCSEFWNQSWVSEDKDTFGTRRGKKLLGRKAQENSELEKRFNLHIYDLDCPARSGLSYIKGHMLTKYLHVISSLALLEVGCHNAQYF